MICTIKIAYSEIGQLCRSYHKFCPVKEIALNLQESSLKSVINDGYQRFLIHVLGRLVLFSTTSESDDDGFIRISLYHNGDNLKCLSFFLSVNIERFLASYVLLMEFKNHEEIKGFYKKMNDYYLEKILFYLSYENSD